MDTKPSIKPSFNNQWFQISQLRVEEIYANSYFVISEGQAILVDPIFDSRIYLDFLSQKKSVLKAILFTKCQIGHISEFFNQSEVNKSETPVYVITGQGNQIKPSSSSNRIFKNLKNGQKLNKVCGSRISVSLISTPGPTLDSCSFILHDQQSDEQICLFSGDFILTGDICRPQADSFQKRKELAEKYYQSLQNLKKSIKDQTIKIYPGHCAGFSGGKSIEAASSTNLHYELNNNTGFKLEKREQFVQKISTEETALPKFWKQISAINQSGQSCFQQVYKNCAQALSLQHFQSLRKQGIVVFDTRHQIGEGLLEKSYWMTQKGDITKWMGFKHDLKSQFLLIVDKGKEQEIIKRFLRVGFWGCKGFNSFEMSEHPEKKIKIQTKTLAQVQNLKKFHIDVRNPAQWQSTGIFPESVLLPLPKFEDSIQQIIERKQLAEGLTAVVNCRSAMRARLAASIMMHQGIIPIVLQEKFGQLKEKGAKLVEWKKQA